MKFFPVATDLETTIIHVNLDWAVTLKIKEDEITVGFGIISEISKGDNTPYPGVEILGGSNLVFTKDYFYFKLLKSTLESNLFLGVEKTIQQNPFPTVEELQTLRKSSFMGEVEVVDLDLEEEEENLREEERENLNPLSDKFPQLFLVEGDGCPHSLTTTDENLRVLFDSTQGQPYQVITVAGSSHFYTLQSIEEFLTDVLEIIEEPDEGQ